MGIKISVPDIAVRCSKGKRHDDGFRISERQEVVGVGNTYGIGMAVTKEELDTNNGRKGVVEIGIHLPDVAGKIKVCLSHMSLPSSIFGLIF